MKESMKGYNMCNNKSYQLWCGSQKTLWFHSEWRYTMSLLVEDKKTHKSIFSKYVLGIYSGITHSQTSYNALTSGLSKAKQWMVQTTVDS
jgi:hypothetical protein